MILIDLIVLIVIVVDLGPLGLYVEIYNVRARDSYTCPTPYGEYRLSDNMRLEVLTLLHPPIAAHRNIVDLLAAGWESGLSEQVRPILVVPYASCGTLDVFSMDPDATIAWKHNIMLDVARGLEVLHGCGIVHGDLKSENVLLFWEGERPVAKLSDFGCSIVNQRQQDRLLGGSPPWN